MAILLFNMQPVFNLLGGVEGKISPKLSSFPLPRKNIANELLIQEPRVSGCTNK